MTVIFLKAGSGTWSVPSDWNSAANTVEIIGAGGGGIEGGTGQREGGGGGEYAKVSNLTLTPGGTADYSVAAGESEADSWFKSTLDVLAKPGLNATVSIFGSGGTGGVGDVLAAGGDGGGSGGNGGGGGGAAGSPNGAGEAGGTVGGNGSGNGGNVAGTIDTGGLAGNSGGTSPGLTGTALLLWTQTSDSEQAGPAGGGGGARYWEAGPGGLYGGGGGGCSTGGPGAGAGRDGIIVITYTPTGGAVTGTLAATETGPDVLAATGAVLISGALAAVEAGSDTFSGAGTVLVSGTMAAVESGADVFAGTGTVSNPAITGTMAAQEVGSDTFAGIGGVQGFRATSSGTQYNQKTLSRIARDAKRAGSKRKGIIVKGIAGAIGNPPQAQQAVRVAISERPDDLVITAPEMVELAQRASEILAIWDEEETGFLLLAVV